MTPKRLTEIKERFRITGELQVTVAEVEFLLRAAELLTSGDDLSHWINQQFNPSVVVPATTFPVEDESSLLPGVYYTVQRLTERNRILVSDSEGNQFYVHPQHIMEYLT